MITIKQTQRKISFCTTDFFKKAQKILRHLDYADYDLGIWLTTNATIKKYNQQFRNKNKATDVLSFPYHPDLSTEARINPATEEDKNLGDIIISLEYVKANNKNLNCTFEQRMDRMLVHAISHLLGYDHIDDDDFKKMITFENELLELIQ